MTKSLVIDASLVFKLILPNPLQAQFRALMTQWKQDGYEICAPALWIYEITSALCKVVHFGQLKPDEGTRALALAQGLEVQLIPPNDAQARLAFDWTMRLNRAAAYDSFYLALAETLGSELWTTDKHLYNAAAQPWVRLVSDEQKVQR
jgi:predicted nucleic acid-binding protein